MVFIDYRNAFAFYMRRYGKHQKIIQTQIYMIAQEYIYKHNTDCVQVEMKRDVLKIQNCFRQEDPLSPKVFLSAQEIIVEEFD